MFKQRRFYYTVFFVLLVLNFVFATPTFACWPHRRLSLEERIDIADVVLVGTVIETFANGTFVTAQVEVETYLQGAGTTVIHIEDLLDGDNTYQDSICNYGFYPRILVPGYRAIFFANVEGEVLHAANFRIYEQRYPADDDTIAATVAYINDPLRLFHRLYRWRHSREAKFAYATLGISGLGIISLSALRFVIKRRMLVQQKAKRGNTDT